MKRKLDAILTDLDGKPFADNTTLKTVIFTVLTTPLEDDGKMAVDVKMKQYGLIKRVHEGGEIDLTSEDITLIKQRAAKVLLSVVVLGRLVEFLESEPPVIVQSIRPEPEEKAA